MSKPSSSEVLEHMTGIPANELEDPKLILSKDIFFVNNMRITVRDYHLAEQQLTKSKKIKKEKKEKKNK